MKTIKLLALLFISNIVFTGCSSDDDHGDNHDHESEVITTVTYTLTNGNDVVTLTFEDLDGEGGEDGGYTISGNLTANTEYSGELTLRNVTDDEDPEHIQEEIEEENEEHEFFYTTSTGLSDITISKEDTDDAGNPLGFETTLTTGDAGTGSITVVLIHEPTKPNNGTSADAGGSTDVEVSYAVTVE